MNLPGTYTDGKRAAQADIRVESERELSNRLKRAERNKKPDAWQRGYLETLRSHLEGKA